jgi:mono/diheme cytochrome c family protein
LEPGAPDAWTDLLQGVTAFREQRYEDAKRLLLRAAKDPQHRALASSISSRVHGAIAAAGQAKEAQASAAKSAFLNTLGGLREVAEQLSKLGHYSLALPLDEAADRLAVQVPGNAQLAGLPPSRLNREDLTNRVTVANRAIARCRQAAALHRLIEASRLIEEVTQVEPERPDLKALQAKVKRGIEDAEDSYKAADSMRRFEKGAIHALSALERGLKYCADHPKLLALRNEMEGLWEERTAPPVTAKLLAAAGAASSQKALEEGHQLYTTRCTECHDLELIDSRSVGGWRTAVSGMARRANLSDTQQARILDYLTAAQNGIEAR